MRVLITTILVRSGVLTHVWDLANHLTRQGVEVSVAIREDGETLINRQINRRDISSIIKPIRGIPLLFYKNKEDLAQFAKERNIQLVHAQSRLVFPSSLAVAKECSVPFIITLHGVFPWQRIYPTALSKASAIITIGPAQAKSAGKRHVKKMKMIENGINVERFKPRIILQGPNVPLRILWFGRSHGLSSEGFKALDKAIQILRKEGRKVEARMIGKAEIENESIRSFQRYGWQEDPVSFLQWGHVAFGHGRSLREAMACGNVGFLLGYGYGGRVKNSYFSGKKKVPVSAIPEYKYPKPRARKIAEELARLDDDRIMLNNLREKAREIAVRYFDVNEMVRKTIKVYRKSLR